MGCSRAVCTLIVQAAVFGGLPPDADSPPSLSPCT
jgi:hypothetical protein